MRNYFFSYRLAFILLFISHPANGEKTPQRSKNLRDQDRQLQSVPLARENSSSPSAPPILWLISFPGSGGSYIIETIRQASGYNTASNDGKFLVNKMGERIMESFASLPIYKDRPNGPYLVSSDLPMPTYPQHIVTDANCEGYCIDCPIDKYLTQYPHSFSMSCSKSVGFTESKNAANAYNNARYDPTLVKKIIHLIRDPFDNVVNRFHEEYKAHASLDDFAFTQEFAFDKKGFHKWCDYLAARHRRSDQAFYLEKFGPELWNLATQVPCYSEFFKYIQWHNNAKKMIHEKKLPTYILRYEDLLQRLEPTIQSILLFSGLPFTEIPNRFLYQKYDYFTERDVINARLFMKELVNEETFSHLEEYFMNTL